MAYSGTGSSHLTSKNASSALRSFLTNAWGHRALPTKTTLSVFFSALISASKGFFTRLAESTHKGLSRNCFSIKDFSTFLSLRKTTSESSQ